MTQPAAPATRIAVLVDCDNTTPEALVFALGLLPSSAQVVVRQGYGNDFTMEQQRWREALVRHAFTPLVQFGTGKNAADIALALDAFELIVDGRADTFYLLTSDADFSALCRKLRNRGGKVFVVGESKTAALLRDACSGFHEFTPAAQAHEPPPPPAKKPAQPAVQSPAVPAPVRKPPQALIDAVTELAAAEPSGWVRLSALGEHLGKKHGNLYKQQGYASLGKMIADCGALRLQATNTAAAAVRLVGQPGKPASVTPLRPAAT